MKKINILLVYALSLGLLVFFGAVLYAWNVATTWGPSMEARVSERRNLRSIRVLGIEQREGEADREEWLGTFSFGREETRRFRELSEIPSLMSQAVMQLEDPRFLEHGGFDVRGILRAAVIGIKNLRFSQGGSTITQQLIKNIFLSPERSVQRKINEIILAAMLEKKFSKDEILEAYLNEVYLGQQGNHQVHGVAMGALYYFGKQLDALEIDEIALLAAVIAGPGHYSPWNHPDRTQERRNKVLRLLRDSNQIETHEYELAIQKKLPARPAVIKSVQASYLMTALQKELLETYSENELISQDLSIVLALDVGLQRIAEQTLSQFAQNQKQSAQPLQAALIGIDPRTCRVLVYAGGTDFRTTQFDRLRQARRPIGSLIKPLVIASLLDDDSKLSLASIIDDSPFEWFYEGGKKSWTPQNFDKKFRGPVTLRQTLEDSLNIAYLRPLYERFVSRLDDAFDPLRAYGFEIPTSRVLPSSLLGVIEQSPVEVALAYSKLVRQALGLAPNAVDRDCRMSFLKDPAPLPLSPSSPREPRAMEAFRQQGSRLTLAALEGAVRRGTSASLGAKLPTDQEWAGKTGTSSDFKDAWYVVVQPEAILLGWVGSDAPQNTGLTGARGALPLVEALAVPLAQRQTQKGELRWPSVNGLSWRRLRWTRDTGNPHQISVCDVGLNVLDLFETIRSTPPPELPAALGTPSAPLSWEAWELMRDNAPLPSCT